MACIQRRSAPAQRLGLRRPAPRRANVGRGAAIYAKAAVSSAIKSALKALRTSGRANVTRATGPWRMTCSVLIYKGPHGVSNCTRPQWAT